jgi:lipopolysaccharide transport protein LptA
MRILRLLFLLGVALTAFFVYRDYQSSRRSRELRLPEAPEAIAANLNSRSGRWEWEQSDAESSRVTVSALGFRQGKDSSTIELSNVELRVYHEGDAAFDRITTPEAVFDMNASRLASETEVVITLSVPADAPDSDASDLTRIVTQGAVFDTKAGTADTENETVYHFADGNGSSRGAFYDSASRYFQMKSQARIERFAPDPGGVRTIITAGRLYYQERDQRIDLREGASLVRGDQRIEAAEADVQLIEGKVRHIDARDACGSDSSGDREVVFSSPKLFAAYGPNQNLEKVVGEGPSEMVSTSPSSRLTVTGERVDLDYVAPSPDEESVLDKAFVRQNGRVLVESLPLGSGDSRLIESSWLQLKMRAGGRSAAFVETLEPGRMAITPANAKAPSRRLEAKRIRVDYDEANRMQSLTAQGDVELERAPATPSGSPLRTWSGQLAVEFDDAGEVESLKQWAGFRFDDGGRTGASAEALFTPAGDQMVMTGKSHVEDPAGRISAHEIRLDQVQERLFAKGDVAAVYRGDSKEKPTGGLFAAEQPVYAAGQEMDSDQKNGVIVYRGAARLWQGANRVEGRSIRIDRPGQKLQAEDEVISYLEEKPKMEGSKPELLVIQARRLDYAEETRSAVYTGDVRLERGDLHVRAKWLEAKLSPADADESAKLERAHATGDVEIFDEATQRRGLGQEAVYLPAQENVILRGGPARAVNEAGEETRGAELNYALNDDRLQVSGGGDRAVTFRRRKR